MLSMTAITFSLAKAARPQSATFCHVAMRPCEQLCYPFALSKTRRQVPATELMWRLAYVAGHFIEMGRPRSAATAEDVDVWIALG